MAPHECDHVIRLHAAWMREELGAGESATSRVVLPDTKPVNQETKSLRYTRKFNRPTGLSPNQSIRFLSELLAVASQVRFNGTFLSLHDQCESLDLTGMLQSHNELAIDIPVGAQPRLAQASAQLVLGPS